MSTWDYMTPAERQACIDAGYPDLDAYADAVDDEWDDEGKNA